MVKNLAEKRAGTRRPRKGVEMVAKVLMREADLEYLVTINQTIYISSR